MQLHVNRISGRLHQLAEVGQLGWVESGKVGLEGAARERLGFQPCGSDLLRVAERPRETHLLGVSRTGPGRGIGGGQNGVEQGRRL